MAASYRDKAEREINHGCDSENEDILVLPDADTSHFGALRRFSHR